MAMRQREFITALGGAVTWSLTTPAQRPDQIRRVRVLMGYAEDDPEAQAQLLIRCA